MIRWVSAYTKCLVIPVSSVGGTKDFNMPHVISAKVEMEDEEPLIHLVVQDVSLLIQVECFILEIEVWQLLNS